MKEEFFIREVADGEDRDERRPTAIQTGSRVTSLVAYRERRLKASPGYGKRVRSKKASQPHRRPVNPQAGSAEHPPIGQRVANANTGPTPWNDRFIFAAILLLGCLIMVGLDL